MSNYGIVVYWPDTPAAAEQILIHAVAMPVTFSAGLSKSRAVIDTLPSASFSCSVTLNGTEKATVSFSAGDPVGVFSCPETWNAAIGDVIEIVAPATADATAAGLAITLMAQTREYTDLYAVLSSSSSISATYDRIHLKAFLSSESSIASRLRERNAFGPQLYTSQSGMLGTLTDCRTLYTKMPSRRGSRLFARLTVTHSPELFK